MAEIEPLPNPEQAPDRIPLEEVYMRMAEELAKRSTCARLQVGSVITTSDLTQVLGIGYNGNARGLPNRCDSAEPGNCGCIHSEQNALIKAGAQLPGKVMFVSASPCVIVAKMIINCNVGRVYYREAYRDPAGLDTLRLGGVEVVHYNRLRDLWRQRPLSAAGGRSYCLSGRSSPSGWLSRFASRCSTLASSTTTR